jgi:hypothetical protein
MAALPSPEEPKFETRNSQIARAENRKTKFENRRFSFAGISLFALFLCSSFVTRRSSLLFATQYTANLSETNTASDSLAQPSKAHTYWTLTNTAYGSATNTTVSTAAMAHALTNPSIIVVGVLLDTSGTVPTPTDTAGNTYHDSGEGQVNTSSWRLELFYANNTHTTASNVVSVSYGSSIGMSVEAAEFTGGATSSPVDQFSGTSSGSTGTGGGQNLSTPAENTTRNGELIVGFQVDFSAAANAGAGFDLVLSTQRYLEQMTQTVAGSVAATWSAGNSNTYGAIMMTLELAPLSYTASPSETNPASDSVSRLGAFGRGPSETNAASDSLARSHGMAVELSESPVVHGEQINWTPSSTAFTVGTYDIGYWIYQGTSPGGESSTPVNSTPAAVDCTSYSTCTYTDLTATAPGQAYYYTVAAVVTETQSTASAPSNEASSVIPGGASDLWASAQVLGRGLSESNPASDAFARQTAYRRGPIETNPASDAFAESHGMFAALGETNPASDALARQVGHVRGLSESNPASDALAKSARFQRAPIETLVPSDQVACGMVYIRGLAETLTLSDLVSDAWAKYAGQPRHQGTLPGRTKSGAVPGRVRSGSAAEH